MVKLLLNSFISTSGANFIAIDTKGLYFNTLLARPEFLRMKLSNFPNNVIKHYQLKEKVDNKMFIYVHCIKGVYEPTHAGIIAQKLPEERLNEQDYYKSKSTPAFWTHKWRPICFPPIVDDFGVK